MTKNGIEFNLIKSDYKYNKGVLTFYFSSKFYLEKFKTGVDEFVENEKRKFDAKYKVPINLYYYFMVVFYKKIEKRGFLVKYKDTLIDSIKFCTNISKFE